MPLSKGEIAAIVLTGAFITFTVGFFAGQSRTGEGFTITEERAADPGQVMPSVAASPEPSAVEVFAPATSTTPAPSPSPAETGFPININTADATRLQELSGIGPVLAERIIEYRTQYGPFAAIEDIMEVRGIGQATFDKLKENITVQ